MRRGASRPQFHRRGAASGAVAKTGPQEQPEYLLPPKTVEALHIYFPDPWPKRKHRKNRLLNQRFTHLARAALIPGGRVYMRTDDADYFAQMKSVFGTCPFFQEIPTPDELAGVLTDFERGFLKRGLQTLRLACQLTDS
jgi:tRNA (guanine-N7-)-methyltransferase